MGTQGKHLVLTFAGTYGGELEAIAAQLNADTVSYVSSIEREFMELQPEFQGHSGLMPANAMTFAHFSEFGTRTR